MDTSTSPVPASTTGPDSRTCTHRSKAILCCCWVLALVIALALAGSLCGAVWRHVFHTDDINITVQKKSVVKITELNQYYDRQLRLFSLNVTNHNVIEIYRFNTSCDPPYDIKTAQYICDIDEERNNYTIDLELKIGKVCIVAHTEYEGGNYDLHLEVTKHVLKVLLTSALPTALFLLALFIGLAVYIIYTIVKVCRRKRNNQYVPVNVQA